MKSPTFRLLLLLALTGSLAACGGKSDDDSTGGGGSGGGGGSSVCNSTDTSVVASSRISPLTEGDSKVWRTGLAAGNYRLDLSSEVHGVKVEWMGAPTCPTASKTASYSNTCALPEGGGLRFTNPADGYGDEHFTVTLTKVSNACLATGKTVIDADSQVLRQGEALTYTFNAGKYRAVVSTPDHGVQIAWSGTSGSCSSTGTGTDTRYDDSCTVTQGGQLTVLNPADAWGDEHVVITVTKAE